MDSSLKDSTSDSDKGSDKGTVSSDLARSLASWFPNILVGAIRAMSALPFDQMWQHLPRVLELRAHRFSAVRREANSALFRLARAHLPMIVAKAKLTLPVGQHAVTAFALLGTAASVAQEGHDHATIKQLSALLRSLLTEAVAGREDPYLMESPPAPIGNIIAAIGDNHDFAVSFLGREFANATEKEATALLSLFWRLQRFEDPMLRLAGLHHSSPSVAAKFADLAARAKTVTMTDIESMLASRKGATRGLGYELLGLEEFRDRAVRFVLPAIYDLTSLDPATEEDSVAFLLSLWGRLRGEDEWGGTIFPMWLNPNGIRSSTARRRGIGRPVLPPAQIKYRISLNEQLAALDKELAIDAEALSSLLLSKFSDLGVAVSRSEPERQRAAQLAALWVGSKMLKFLSATSRSGWEDILMFWSLGAETDAERALASADRDVLGFGTALAA